ncbi:MAG: NADH-quinone oxidoreductase subunit NuoH [Anaerolineaceae bacterium]|nr:NADH-quinone oxidoreductase subunit NuoH [Anaerolineaceae bacterium]
MELLIDPITFLVELLTNQLLVWGLSAELIAFIIRLLGAAILPAGAMFFCLFLIWVERKLLARVQDRIGPNRLGPWGIFQTVADMAKIFIKEHVNPTGFDPVTFNLAPVLSVASVLLVWAVLPFTITFVGVDLNVGLLYVIGVGGFGIIGEIMAGWGSNNKYALISTYRAVAILISFEVPMILILIIPVMLSGSMSLPAIVQAQDVWFIIQMPVAALVFFITSIAEMARSPFDLLEAESELVSGFNIEYSGLKFGMFYVADFLRAFTFALLFSTVFLGGWRGPFADQIPIIGFVYLGLKTSVVYFLGILIRGSMPRFRIDQMLNLNWKVFTPLSLALVIGVALVNKLFPQANDFGMTALKIAVFISMNVVLLLITNWIIGKRTNKDPIPVVVKENRTAVNYSFKDVSS